MRFTKMHGCGNDYVYVNLFEEKVENPAEVSIKVSDRHFGIGSDGLITIGPSDKADFRMHIYNADGSEAEMCGNGIRCVAKYVYDSYNNGSERSTAAVGWYAYYLNDSRQYEALNIFDVLLNRLHESTKPGQWENIDDFSSTLAAEVCEKLGAANISIGELLGRWDFVEEPEEKMTHAFYVILDNYKRNPSYKECKSIIRSFFRSVSNDALDAFDDTEKNLNCSTFLFIKKFLTENIIYNHYSESMRKFSQNGIPTQKLTIENGYVRGIATYSATHSSPRIDTLRNYATDLGLIDDYQVTEKGLELLEQLQDD